jgi:hypothetical protein
MINRQFDDYLDLLNYDFSNYKYIVFVWNSWSGKSTYIKNLIRKNNTFSKDLIVIDEIFDILDFIKYFVVFFSKKQFIIASHINIYYFYFFRFLGKIKYIKTDTNHFKICNYLQCKKLSYTWEVVEEYIKYFSSTYTDIDIILENYNWNNFDEAFKLFIKFNKIFLTWNKNGKKK